MVLMFILTALAVAGIAGTIRLTLVDGYRRQPRRS